MFLMHQSHCIMQGLSYEYGVFQLVNLELIGMYSI